MFEINRTNEAKAIEVLSNRQRTIGRNEADKTIKNPIN